ncbi:MAG: hypothetical protein ABIO70_11785 [Pseudomonadota bacterium]
MAIACNVPPGVPVVGIEPEAPQTADDLVAVILTDAPDEDGDPLTYTYTWYRGDDAETTGPTLAASETAKHEIWKVVVVANDGKEDGPPSQASVTIANTPPAASVALSPTAPLTTDDIAATAESWDDDDDVVELSYDWLLGGELTNYHDFILPAAATERGQVWTARITPNDGEEDGAPASAEVSIENAPPVVESVVLDPSEAYEGSTLTALVDASDPDSDALTLSYAWAVDGVLVREGAEATLSGEHFDKHQQVVLTVTPNDGFVDGEPVDSAAVEILDSAPALTSATIDPPVLYEANTAACLPSGWADDDGDAEQYLTSWSVDGVTTAGVETLDGATFDKGQPLTCTLTPCDGEVCGEPVTSDPVVVSNTPPTLASATLSSPSPAEGDTLSVALGTTADDDGDTVTIQYAWYVDGAIAAGTPTLPSSHFAHGDSIYCVVTPWDGTSTGTPVTSNTAVVVNTAPEVRTVALSPISPHTSDTLSAVVSSFDADGDAVSLTYTWTVDSGAIAATGASLAGTTWFDKGDVVQVTVTPNDGAATGASLSSSAVTVLNTAPTPPTVSIDPAAPQLSDDLRCILVSASTDADGDPIDYAFAWTVDGAATSSPTTTTWTGDTVPAASTTNDQVWVCSVVASDGEDDSTAATAIVEIV